MATRTHVQIRPNVDGLAWSVKVDGHEMANHIASDGLRVEFVCDESGYPRAQVTIVLPEVDLDADLPESVVTALSEAVA